MELYWLDVPDPRPIDRAFLLPGEALTGFASLAVHAGQHLCIEVALIERGFAAPDHGSHNARKSFDAADGANGVGMLTRDRADLERQFRGGSQRVVPRLHGRRTGMRLLAVEGDGVT